VALGMVRNLRSLADSGETAACQEHLMAEYVLAPLAHGVADRPPADVCLGVLRAFTAS